ncbi:MAG: protein rep [Hyphomicrobium sp.]
MTHISPTMAKLRRRQLHKKSTLAASEALWKAANNLPRGRLRTFIAKKAQRTEACGAMAFHRLVTKPGQPSFVASSNSRACSNRHCVSCEAKRANQLAQDTIELFDYVWKLYPGARVLMLTLTARNRPLEQTRAMLLDHQRALKVFWSFKRIVDACLGHFTNIEVDFERRNGKIFAHVHSHSLVATAPGALSDHRYIRQAEYVALWQRALRVSYKPIVDIRAIKSRDGLSTDPSSIRGAVREACKYCLDTEGFIEHENGHLRVDPQVVVAFALAVHRRRLTSMDRIFNDAKKLRAKER